MRPVTERHRLGALGEGIAARRLASGGHVIVARNWRCARGEIDIVARRGATYVFVEVKTRRSRRMGPPEAAVTPRKAAKLMELAQHYLLAHELGDVAWQVDVIAVELDRQGSLVRCEHFPHALRGW